MLQFKNREKTAKKFCRILLSTAVVFSVVLSAFSVSAATQADAASSFTFSNGKMSKEVLRSYASRAITHQGFTVGNTTANPIFEEDLRMILRIGAKYIGRAALYSWGGSFTADQVEEHYKLAKEKAALVHKADPEIILQAGIFEIAYKGTVNNTKIPAYVFEAFGQKVENRNFVWSDIVYPEGHPRGIGAVWSSKDAGVPDITQLETKMYFYYCITRYIDAGYEAFHMGQVELMGGTGDGVNDWAELLDKARAYAKTHARRGIALFDCHVGWNSPGMKVGDQLVFDIQGAPMFPHETAEETVGQDTVMKAEIGQNSEHSMSYLGQITGGKHPLGFEVETNFTIVEFDNFGPISNPGESNGESHGTWGFDDVTWFAVQPEWYRNQFLKECDAYLSSHNLDSQGKQQYFLQPVTCRVITPGTTYTPDLDYTPRESYHDEFFFDFMDAETVDVTVNDSGSLKLSVRTNYHANRQSDGCPIGFNQEDTIREIFLGKNAKEDSELLKVVLPSKYADEEEYVTEAVDPTSSKATANTSSKKDNTTANTGSTANTASVTSAVGEEISSEEVLTTESDETGSAALASSDATTGTDKPKGSALPWIIVGIIAVLLLGGGIVFYFLYFAKKTESK